MNTPRTTSVKLLDKEYVIACPEENEAQLLAAADYLKKKMQEVKASGRIIGLEKIAVMAALNISHELLHSSQGNEAQLEQRLQQLSAKIEQGLGSLEP
ncbi:cell division protein ZapA [Amphritea sp. HPY]|uniref:cell division protein ZapA n=1 Tax=Amphritea sp. HPY TaxID=3421652 RepID=UPI003D7EB985